MPSRFTPVDELHRHTTLPPWETGHTSAQIADAMVRISEATLLVAHRDLLSAENARRHAAGIRRKMQGPRWEAVELVELGWPFPRRVFDWRVDS
jgi:hypothetical protein